MLGAALEAFIGEHKYCGELDTGLEKAAIAAPVSRVLPMDLQLGDRRVDERGEWRVSDEDASPG